MGNKVDLNKPRETNNNVKKGKNYNRPNVTTNNNSTTNLPENNNSGRMEEAKNDIAKAVLKANGLPPELADYAEKHPEQMKKISGTITGMKMPAILRILPIVLSRGTIFISHYIL